ncbi:MAG: hypothetical protein Q4Q06_05930 [Bacteroidota bacterium]|nr:hypothetical protein [Bacteroidota bacterium]
MKTMRKIFLFLFVFLFFCVARGQNKIQADVTIQQLINKKVLTINKQIFYQTNGKLVTRILEPEEIFTITNALGEVSCYMPKENTAWTTVAPSQSSKNEILAIFSSNSRYDLGLSDLGFVLESQKKDSTRIVKTYIPKTKHKEISKIIMVYQDDKPIYCGYYNKENRENKKIYYQNYLSLPKFFLPQNITEISITNNNDTIIRRQIFSNIKYDKEAGSEYFNFQIPESATKTEGIKLE